jgi:hypothetical protein
LRFSFLLSFLLTLASSVSDVSEESPPLLGLLGDLCHVGGARPNTGNATGSSKNKNELPAARIYRQCNPKAIEVAFLTIPATEFFAEDQYQVLQTHYLDLGYGLEPMDAAVNNDAPLLPRPLAGHVDVWQYQVYK